MENATFTISVRDIYFFLILLASMWGVIKIFREIRQPSNDLKKIVSDHDLWLKRDIKRMQRIEDCQDLLLESLDAIISHEITGNGVDDFKSIQKKTHSYLLKRGRNISDD